MRAKTIACGGCGETNPEKRCVGCLHDFGDPGSAWVKLPQAATALAEAQAQIARCNALLDRSLENVCDLMTENTRLKEALGGIKVMEPDRFHSNSRNDLIACAAWEIANGALSPATPSA